jgi:hypothetical protein
MEILQKIESRKEAFDDYKESLARKSAPLSILKDLKSKSDEPKPILPPKPGKKKATKKTLKSAKTKNKKNASIAKEESEDVAIDALFGPPEEEESKTSS